MSKEKSLCEKKANAHDESWQDYIDSTVGRSSRELAIYNRQEVEGRLHDLHQGLIELEELKFIDELKELDKEIGVYLVGGTVRDAVIGKESKDVDLIVNGIDPVDLINVLLKYGKVVFDRAPKADLATMSKSEKRKLVVESYGVLKFQPTGSKLKEPIDIAFPREDDYSQSGQAGILGVKRDAEAKVDPNLPIKSDLKRRDLTINAMAINLVDGTVVDYYDGIEGLVRGEIKTVGDPRERILKEDLSRGFRAVRFACVFGANIEGKTKKAIKEIFRPADYNSVEESKKKIEKMLKVIQLIEEGAGDQPIKENKAKEAVSELVDSENLPLIEFYKERLAKINKLINRNKGELRTTEKVGKTMMLIGELGRISAKRSESDHKERVKEIEQALTGLADEEIAGPGTDLIKEINELLDCSLINRLKFRLEQISKQIDKLERNTRKEYNIPEGENLPRFLQIFCDKAQLGEPRVAVSKETISKELQKAIKADPKKCIELLDEVGGLDIIFPEIAALKNLQQPREHHKEGDAYRHTLLLLDHLPKDASLRLKLAGLLHDLGKKDTQAKDSAGKITFHGHAKEGVQYIEKIAKRLRLPNNLTRDVIWLVEKHMLPLSNVKSEMKASTIEKNFLQDEELGQDLIRLSQADAMASIPEEGEPNLESINALIVKIEELKKKSEEAKKFDVPQLITGKDLIDLGLKPGPVFKQILERVREAQLDGKVSSKDEAIKIAEEIKEQAA